MARIIRTNFMGITPRAALIAAMALMATFVIMLGGTNEAIAQDDSAAPRAALDEVLVRARKRTEPLQRTPVAVTTIGGRALEMRYAADLKTMEFPAPNVNIARISAFSNAISISIRGIQNSDIDSTVDPPVAILVDGIYIARPVASSMDLFDVEQIEILRGPQGTLFGRNTTAGAIQIRTRRPTGEFGSRGRITAGDFGRLDVRASFDIPVIEDKLDAKIAFQSQNMDGYYKSSITGQKLGAEDIISIRPMLRFTPSEDFDLTIIGEYHRNRSEVSPQQNESRPNQLLCLLHGFCGFALGEGNEFLVDFDPALPIEATIWGITIDANWNIGPGTISWVSNWRDTDEFIDLDVDNTAATMFQTDRTQPHEQGSTELRFASSAWEKFDFVTGVYFFYQSYFLERNTFLGIVPGTGITHLVSNTSQDHYNISVFGEGNYHLNEKWTFTLGGRFTWERKEFFQEPFGPGAAGARITSDPVNWTNFGPKAGFQYQVNDDVMVYFNYSRGFKSGGFNGRCGQPVTCSRPFNPEIVDGFEVGSKSEFFDNTLRLNLALFWNEYDNLQRTVIVPLPGAANPQETVTDNAASATVRGVELEVTAVPTDGLTVGVGAGYLDASYSDFCVDLNGASNSATVPTSECGAVVSAGDIDGDGVLNYLVDEDLSAFSLARAPGWTFSFDLTYEIQVGNTGNIVLNGRYSFTSKLFTDATESSLRRPTNMLDGSITYEDIDGRYRISIFGRNLTNNIYATSRTLVAALLDTRAVNAPRRWGVEIGWSL